MRFLESVAIRRTIQVLLLAWAAFVIFLYIVHHHHWLEYLEHEIPRILESVFQYVILKLLWVIGFLIVGYGLGRGVLDLFRVSYGLDTDEDDITFSVAVGWGLIGLGTFFLGSLGFLKPALHIALAIIILAATHRQIIGLAKRVGKSWTDIDLSRTEFFLILTIFTIALWGLWPSLVPEWGFDSLNSHLPAPATYLAEGRISFHPEINFNNFPEIVEMWYLQSMILIPDGCAQLLMGVCHLLTALVIYAMARRFYGRGAGLVSVLIYLLVKKAYLFATLAYIDQGLTLMIVLGTYAVLRYMENPSRALAVLAGLTFGFACGIKYSAFINVLTVAVVVLVYEAFAKRNHIRLAIDLALAAAIIVLIACPWYIRNWIWFQNPVFPFFPGIFETNAGTYASLAHDLRVDHREMLDMFRIKDEVRANPIMFALLPYKLVIEPYGPYDRPGIGALGPWFLITLPLIVFVRRIPRVTWAILGLIVFTYAYWWYWEKMLHLRYMLPIFSMQAIFAGFLAWEGLRLDKVNPRGFLGWMSLAVLFGILVTFFAGIVTPEQIRAEFPILPEERAQFQSSRMNAFPAVEGMNETLLDALGDPEQVAQTRVYGFYMEQYRWFADFKLIGNQVGYADHTDYLAHCRSAEDLHEWLTDLECVYLMINLPYAQLAIKEEARRGVPGLQLDVGQVMPGWEEYFDFQESYWEVFIFRVK